MNIQKGTKEAIQFILAGFVLLAGVTLVFTSLFIPPQGEIDASVITCFGLFLGFVGAVWGLDLKYDYKTKELVDRYQNKVQPYMEVQNENPSYESTYRSESNTYREQNDKYGKATNRYDRRSSTGRKYQFEEGE